jgi:hypothetical protein
MATLAQTVLDAVEFAVSELGLEVGRGRVEKMTSTSSWRRSAKAKNTWLRRPAERVFLNAAGR